MSLDKGILSGLRQSFGLRAFVRIVPARHAQTPLGMGWGRSRFASPDESFRLLYVAKDCDTAVAETIVRDRFQSRRDREILKSELGLYALAEVRSLEPLHLLDLRYDGASLLGVDTDAVRARDQRQGRQLSASLYRESDLDGVLYMSRITNRACVAVYDRAVGKLSAGPAVPLLRARGLAEALRRLHVAVRDADGSVPC